MKPRTFDYILLCAFVILIISFLVILIEVRTEGGKCYTAPINYGIASYEKASNSSIYCVCNFVNEKYSPLLFTSNGISVYDAFNIGNYTLIKSSII